MVRQVIVDETHTQSGRLIVDETHTQSYAPTPPRRAATICGIDKPDFSPLMRDSSQKRKHGTWLPNPRADHLCADQLWDPLAAGIPERAMQTLLTLSLFLGAASAFVPVASFVRTPSMLAARPCAMALGRGKGDKKNTKKSAAEEIFGEVDVDDAADAIAEWAIGEDPTMLSTPSPTPTPTPTFEAPDVEETLVAAIKTSKTAFDAALEFERENEVTKKIGEATAAAIQFERDNEVTKKIGGAFNTAVAFWKENELGYKAFAVATLVKDEVEKADVKLPQASQKKAPAVKKAPAAKKAPAVKKAPAAKKAPAVPKQWASKSKKPAENFKMPDIKFPF